MLLLLFGEMFRPIQVNINHFFRAGRPYGLLIDRGCSPSWGTLTVVGLEFDLLVTLLIITISIFTSGTPTGIRATLGGVCPGTSKVT